MVERQPVSSHVAELDPDADSGVWKQSDLHGEEIGHRRPIVRVGNRREELWEERVEQSDVVWLVGGDFVKVEGGGFGDGEGNRVAVGVEDVGLVWQGDGDEFRSERVKVAEGDGERGSEVGDD